MAQEKGYRCPYTGKAFAISQLDGYGQPPRSPACPVGLGSGSPMIPIVIVAERSPTGRVLYVEEIKDKLWGDLDELEGTGDEALIEDAVVIDEVENEVKK